MLTPGIAEGAEALYSAEAETPNATARPVSEAERQAALDVVQAQIRACRLCAEAGYFVGAPVVTGRLGARVMVIGQAPSEAAAREDRPFAWRDGRPRPRLWDWLASVGWPEEEFRALAYLTPVTKCYPGRARSGEGDRRPTAAEVRLCAPYLDRELALVDPDLILTVGTLALARLGIRARLDDVVGQTLTLAIAQRERVVIPLPHPSGVSRWLNAPDQQARLAAAMERIRETRGQLGL
ncbi:MAG: uracil-DNA glycosylase [Anaerolineae bacterium]|nr:uracil-DNA glycosylase [Anaerolineae bacterium]